MQSRGSGWAQSFESEGPNLSLDLVLKQGPAFVLYGYSLSSSTLALGSILFHASVSRPPDRPPSSLLPLPFPSVRAFMWSEEGEGAAQRGSAVGETAGATAGGSDGGGRCSRGAAQRATRTEVDGQQWKWGGRPGDTDRGTMLMDNNGSGAAGRHGRRLMDNTGSGAAGRHGRSWQVSKTEDRLRLQHRCCAAEVGDGVGTDASHA
ncbi:unnamed protein product [Closterium sp. Naga37s-1]|nr:unnamed protein product [Closterium sp. Naga37s-1]